ncbi:Ankyrin repeat protein 2 [Giardia muris]|uniref:Ankyrin repeat protein 2 n=1 Tax=Giardia muris TaxID=5742 RepID=A0A4Z1SRB3_GIAMU|nr:Ankyrin repeat protein 2 [Giardia muris]|eukprot:TNJ27505.1 Ankyrin repeat protein 2 [Giardia muris]
MRDLIDAARRGDVAGVLEHIGQAGQRDGQQKTALMYAAMGGHLRCVELLIPHEAGLQDNQEWPAILFAARDGHPDVIRALLPFETGLTGEYGQTALMTAALNCHLDCAELLLHDAGRVTTGRILSYPSGTTALMIAASKHNTRIAELILPFEQGLRNSEGHSATWYMRRNGRRRSSSSDSSSDSGFSAGSNSSSSGSHFREGSVRAPPPTASAQSLIIAVVRQNEEDIHAHITEAGERKPDGSTALMTAAMTGYVRGVEILLDLEAGLQDNEGKLALDYAIMRGKFDCAKLLLSTEADVRDSQGHTAFDRHITKHNDVTIRLLTLLNAELSPLETAILRNYDVCAAALLLQAEGLDVNPGCTSLMAGVIIDREDLVLKHLEKVGGQDNQGRTALMYAAIHNKPDLVHFFTKTEAGKVDNSGWTALMHAVKKDHVEVARLLLCEAGVQAFGDNGTTALILAAEKGNVELVTLLAPYEIGLCTTKGTTALSVVREKHFRSQALVDLLSEDVPGSRFLRLQPLPISLSPLAQAAIENDLKKLRNAMKKSQEPLAGEKTALMLAAERGLDIIVNALRVRELGRQDANGWTALMYATRHGKVSCVKLLLDEAELETAQGVTALDIAESSLSLSSPMAEYHTCKRLLQDYLRVHQSSLVQNLSGAASDLTKIRDSVLLAPASKDVDALNADLSAAIDALKRIHPLAQKYDQSLEQNKVQKLQKSLDEAQATIKELKESESKLMQLQDECQMRAKHEEELKDELAAALQRETSLKDKCTTLEAKITTLSNSVELTERLDESRKKCEALEKELVEMRGKMNDLARIPPQITSAEEYSIVELDALETNLSASLRVVSGARAAYSARACVICMEAPKSIVLKPCCHLCVCDGCASGLKGKPCPICRKSVEGTMRVYD